MMDMYLDATGTGALNFTASNLPMGLYVDGQYIRGTPSMQAAYTSSVMITATDDIWFTNQICYLPSIVNASGGGGSVTWNTSCCQYKRNIGWNLNCQGSAYDFYKFICYRCWYNYL